VSQCWNPKRGLKNEGIFENVLRSLLAFFRIEKLFFFVGVDCRLDWSIVKLILIKIHLIWFFDENFFVSSLALAEIGHLVLELNIILYLSRASSRLSPHFFLFMSVFISSVDIGLGIIVNIALKLIWHYLVLVPLTRTIHLCRQVELSLSLPRWYNNVSVISANLFSFWFLWFIKIVTLELYIWCDYLSIT